uniref:AIG1-type G domain-containing protein n=1 Tax=Daphnia magna TaxID=35525 RepID=A0A0P5RSW1_9CRUS
MDPIRLSALGRDVCVGNHCNYFTDEIMPDDEFVNMDPIRLSALGRDVCVGNYYNYFTDEIMLGCIHVLEQNVHHISVPKVERTFFFQQPDKFKYHMLGINSHLCQSNAGNSKNLWFAGYLETGLTQEDANKSSTAQVDVIFRVVKRIETLGQQHFEPTNMFHYQLITGGQATHVVEEVVYGVELICSMQRDVDLNCETKAIVEEDIYLAAKTYFDENMDMNSFTADLPVELKKVTCIVFTSTEAGNEKKGSFQAFCEWSRLIINESKDCPIEIVLRDIPSQIEARLVSEKMNHIEIEKEMNFEMWKWIKSESHSIARHPLIDCIPPLEKVMCQFIDLLQPIGNSIETIYATNRVLNDMKLISCLLADMKEWLIHRRKEIQITCSLLLEKRLMMMGLKEIENRKSQNKRARVFILKMDYTRDMSMERMKNFIGEQKNSERPVFHIVTMGKLRLHHLSAMLKAFSEQSTNCPDTDYLIGLVPSSSSLEDGMIVSIPEKTFVPGIISNGLQNTLNDPIKNNKRDSSDFQPNLMLFPEVKSPLVPTVYNLRYQLSPAIKTFIGPSGNYLPRMTIGRTDEHHQTDSSATSSPHLLCSLEKEEDKQAIALDAIKKVESPSNATIQIQKETRMMEPPKKDTCVGTCPEKKMSKISVAARIENVNAKSKEKAFQDKFDQSCEVIEIIDEKMEPLEEKMSSEDHENNRPMTDINSQDHDMEMNVSSEIPVSNRRIAEIFADGSKRYADLIKEGQPNIYQLNAKEILANEDFRWFEINRLDGSSPTPGRRDHKIIILMGATGCGKSTLINGMVNYILGVQWNDPFRFKCVREDEGVTRNQAHSQTSSVTAYTLRHQEGMSIPHSITIIDTPGYGDTRGIERDKKITANIHRFLTQEETRINEIHAACFVAASGDSRLTATQRYIIDSVLSIFGKDMKENLRLLVTFADNADPPVVEACGAANFPATSVSAGISYSKFNSSVLYCSNAQKENEFCFDELFWDMGQENFHKFFTMLAEMDARNLTSTREVIQRRQQLEQSLQEIESELEICLVNIEDMEKFRQQLIEHGHNMKTNKNFVVERTEMQPVKVDCDKGLLVFNCSNCMTTCDKPSKKLFQNRTCKNEVCKCQKSYHQVQPFTWTLRLVKVKTTLNEMKAKFESSANQKCTTEELMANCSDELNIAKAKVLSLLDQVGANARSLDSTALRSNALNPSEYLSLMRSRVLEEQAPGYLTRLQTLTELQQSLDASATSSAKKGQSSGSQVTTQPFNNANTSLGRGRLLQTSATGSANASESKSNNPGKNGLDNTLSRSSQIQQPSCGQVTAPSVKRYETRSHIQPNMNGTDPSKSASITSSNTQTCGGSRGRGRGNILQQTETAASLIHGTDSQWKHPPGTPEEYYQTAVKTFQRPCSKDGDKHNPDGSNDSATGPSSSVQGDTKQEPKVIPSFNHPGDDKGTYSSDDENKKTEKKSEGLIACARRSLEFFWNRK